MNLTHKIRNFNHRRFRDSVAALVTLGGLVLVGALWMRELTGAALLDALLGAIYLFVGIGLFGQSRFTLFVAMGITAGNITSLYTGNNAEEITVQARMLLDGLIFIACFGLLFAPMDKA